VTEPIEVREAVPEDEVALVDLWWGMQHAHHAYDARWYADHGEAACKASWAERFRKLIDVEDALILAAVKDGLTVGLLLATHVDRPPIYTTGRMAVIACTAVHPDYYRQGIFRAMLAVLEDRAREAGIEAIRLSVHHDNPAVQAYEQTGFEPETVAMVKWV
jgi:GNAT superfamily N-acetyltransferase